ncbi:MAG: GNAT family N-acetyltransferase [Ilumatobacteraceae bacterium]|nr:GNAT family N-acetyltransferase [Ilumatobacter sp.]MCO5328655.1 GNAT family N-acetyltransferase [Ilumatobacteraceae bacterium]
MEIRRLGTDDVGALLTAGHLFDHAPTVSWAADTLARPGHHLLLATVDGSPAGFVTGIEHAHPDKGVEMLVYELGVDDEFRRRGVATALLDELAALARRLGCYGMWVPVDPDNDAALALYRGTGAVGAEAVILTWEFGQPPDNPATAAMPS